MLVKANTDMNHCAVRYLIFLLEVDLLSSSSLIAIAWYGPVVVVFLFGNQDYGIDSLFPSARKGCHHCYPICGNAESEAVGCL